MRRLRIWLPVRSLCRSRECRPLRLRSGQALTESVSQLFFRPFGAESVPTHLPTASAVGCNLAPLRGYFEALMPLSNSRSSCDTVSLRDLILPKGLPGTYVPGFPVSPLRG